MEALDHLGDEVRVAGRIHDRDLVLAVLERPDREAQGLVALLLLGLVVEMRGPVVDAAQARMAPARKRTCSASVVLPAPAWPASTTERMCGEVVALDGHRSRYLVLSRGRGVAKTAPCGGDVRMRAPTDETLWLR